MFLIPSQCAIPIAFQYEKNFLRAVYKVFVPPHLVKQIKKTRVLQSAQAEGC